MIICLKVYYLHIKQKKWSFIKRQTSTSSDNEWQQMTTSDSEWQRKTKSGATSGKEWQRVPNGVKKWQWVTTSESSGKANENGTEHFKEWMIAIILMTKRDTLLLQGVDGCN